MNDFCLPAHYFHPLRYILVSYSELRAQCRYLSFVGESHRPPSSYTSPVTLTAESSSHESRETDPTGGISIKSPAQCSGFIAKYWSLEQLCAILLVMRHICNCFAFIIVGMVGHANYVWESPQYQGPDTTSVYNTRSWVVAVMSTMCVL